MEECCNCTLSEEEKMKMFGKLQNTEEMQYDTKNNMDKDIESEGIDVAGVMTTSMELDEIERDTKHFKEIQNTSSESMECDNNGLPIGYSKNKENDIELENSLSESVLSVTGTKSPGDYSQNKQTDIGKEKISNSCKMVAVVHPEHMDKQKITSGCVNIVNDINNQELIPDSVNIVNNTSDNITSNPSEKITQNMETIQMNSDELVSNEDKKTEGIDITGNMTAEEMMKNTSETSPGRDIAGNMNREEVQPNHVNNMNDVNNAYGKFKENQCIKKQTCTSEKATSKCLQNEMIAKDCPHALFLFHESKPPKALRIEPCTKNANSLDKDISQIKKLLKYLGKTQHIFSKHEVKSGYYGYLQHTKALLMHCIASRESLELEKYRETTDFLYKWEWYTYPLNPFIDGNKILFAQGGFHYESKMDAIFAAAKLLKSTPVNTTFLVLELQLTHRNKNNIKKPKEKYKSISYGKNPIKWEGEIPFVSQPLNEMYKNISDPEKALRQVWYDVRKHCRNNSNVSDFLILEREKEYGIYPEKMNIDKEIKLPSLFHRQIP